MRNAATKAALRERPPKQCTKTPPAAIPASIKMLDAGMQDKTFDVSLSRISIDRYVNWRGKVEATRDALRMCVIPNSKRLS